MKDDDTKREMIVVHTARKAPSWMQWSVYAILVGGLYMYEVAPTGWPLYVATGLAASTTYILYGTYNALVTLFNEVRVNEAVMAHQQSQEKSTSSAQMEAHDQVATGTKVLGTASTEVEPGEPSSKDITLFRYAEALASIQECKEIGEARDIAWRAVEHDNLEARKAEEYDKG